MKSQVGGHSTGILIIWLINKHLFVCVLSKTVSISAQGNLKGQGRTNGTHSLSLNPT